MNFFASELVGNADLDMKPMCCLQTDGLGGWRETATIRMFVPMKDQTIRLDE